MQQSKSTKYVYLYVRLTNQIYYSNCFAIVCIFKRQHKIPSLIIISMFYYVNLIKARFFFTMYFFGKIYHGDFLLKEGLDRYNIWWLFGWSHLAFFSLVFFSIADWHNCVGSSIGQIEKLSKKIKINSVSFLFLLRKFFRLDIKKIGDISKNCQVTVKRNDPNLPIDPKIPLS